MTNQSEPPWKDLLASTGAVVTITGGLIYGLIYFAYVSYYRSFGLSLRDVGIGPSQIISSASVGLGWYGAVVLLVGAGAWLANEGVKASTPDASPTDRRVIRLLVAILALIVLPVAGSALNGYWWTDGYRHYVVLGESALLAATLYWGWPWGRRPKRSVFVVWTAALAVAYLCASFFLVHRGGQLAGYTLRDQLSFQVNIFDITPVTVCAELPGQDQQREYIYLGSDSSSWLLLSPTVHTGLPSRPPRPSVPVPAVNRVPNNIPLTYPLRSPRTGLAPSCGQSGM